MKKFLFIIMVLWLGGCNHSSEDTSVLEARRKGWRAAINVLQWDSNENFDLEGRVIEAKSIQLMYLEAGDTACANAFDEAFREYIIENNDSLAQEIF